MNYVGIDLHKRSTYVSVMNKEGELIMQKRVLTEPEELKLLLDRVPKPFSAVIEASRNWYWVYDLVEEIAEEVKLAHPPKTRLIAEARIKTDKIDSKILADLLRTDYLPTCYVG
ncbi:MAG: transposase [Candidatus Ratteibacteria bacterium]